mmetsp:Transcript_27666/g.71022  ORF Transcript_27666/g.71022 Transcript_27666/m.71022 type:complete len:250 (-) Transcript_27666:322-1071(-)
MSSIGVEASVHLHEERKSPKRCACRQTKDSRHLSIDHIGQCIGEPQAGKNTESGDHDSRRGFLVVDLLHCSSIAHVVLHWLRAAPLVDQTHARNAREAHKIHRLRRHAHAHESEDTHQAAGSAEVRRRRSLEHLADARREVASDVLEEEVLRRVAELPHAVGLLPLPGRLLLLHHHLGHDPQVGVLDTLQRLLVVGVLPAQAGGGLHRLLPGGALLQAQVSVHARPLPGAEPLGRRQRIARPASGVQPA